MPMTAARTPSRASRPGRAARRWSAVAVAALMPHALVAPAQAEPASGAGPAEPAVCPETLPADVHCFSGTDVEGAPSVLRCRSAGRATSWQTRTAGHCWRVDIRARGG